MPLLACPLICSPEYVALVRRTQTLDKEELRALSQQFDAVYFHPVRASKHTPIYVPTPMCIHTPRHCPPANVFSSELMTIPCPVLLAICPSPVLLSCGRPAAWDKQVRQQANLHSGPQNTFHCARLAVGAALQLVDAVLTGAAHNGLALVR